MASLFDSKTAVGLACVAAAAIGAGSVVWLRGGSAAPAAAPAAQRAGWDAPTGPGGLAAGAAATQPAAATSLADGAGNLRIDAALRTLFDSYLAQSGAAARAARAAQLHAYLDSRLAPPARGQAADLVDAYLRYLRAEAELRAQLRFTRPDPSGLSDQQVDQMLAWQQERAHLRERMLGTTVAQAWFGADDGDCQSALEDWRKMRAPAGAEEVDSNELRARRLHGAVLEQGRNERAQACAARLLGGPA
jgi:lipase chaperone LimK